MIPAAPTSTLFPYTTLFRSGRRIVSPGRPPPGATRRGEPGRGRHLFRPSRLTGTGVVRPYGRSEEHTSELQSRGHLVCRLLLEKKNKLERHTGELNKQLVEH